MKRHSRFLSNDSTIVIALAGMILLVAFGGIKLSRVVAANMLRADGQSTSSVWAVTLADSVDEIPAILNGAPPSDKMNDPFYSPKALLRLRFCSQAGFRGSWSIEK